MKRVAITGGTGFIGANLTGRLLAEGHEVHLLVRAGSDHWRIDRIREHVRLHEVDLRDAAALENLIRALRPDWVFHLAAHGAYSWQSDVQRIVETNFLGTVNLVQACLQAGFESFVNTGSSSEYGFKDHAPTEAESLEPNSCYAVAKASATLFCRFTARERGARMPTLRLYSVYGPYEHPDRLIPSLIREGTWGRLPPLVGPETARDFVYVEDAVDAYVLAARGGGRDPGAVYNVGTGVQTSLRDLVELARRVLNVRAEPEWGSMPARAWDTAVWIADNSKIGAELGWRPRYTVEAGLTETVRWFREAAVDGRVAPGATGTR